MTLWILNFGEGSLAANYLIFTTVASLGVLQFVAGRGRLVGLMLFSPRLSRWLGLALVFGAYVWFFATQPDLLIPGLAGGEFFTLFFMGFVLAALISIALGIVNNRIFSRGAFKLPRLREPVALMPGLQGEVWLPDYSRPPLVIALREANADSLDVLSADLVAGGAAVLLCDEAAAEAAVLFAETNAERFHPSRSYAIGVGRGADRVLRLADDHGKFNNVIALAPFGDQMNARRGLRWLRETDYVSALAITYREGEIAEHRSSSSRACIVYGDEDTLIPLMSARLNHPTALLVAGARHFTLARMAATKRLAADYFELGASAMSASGPVTVTTTPIREGLGK
jgi:hypothetical protein